jgi:hypothetical protein
MQRAPFPQYEACGKEVIEINLTMEDVTRTHYADAIDPEAALAIAYALNSVFLAKLGPQRPRDPICPTCKEVGMHAANCVEGRSNADAR